MQNTLYQYSPYDNAIRNSLRKVLEKKKLKYETLNVTEFLFYYTSVFDNQNIYPVKLPPIHISNFSQHFFFFLTWKASQICVSSLVRDHADLLCCISILVYVIPKWAHWQLFIESISAKISVSLFHLYTFLYKVQT